MGRPGVVPVFVGNISFDTTDEMVREVFAEVGPVLAVRLVLDKETGKAKGYGFVEFADSTTAECAVRHLNGREIAGRQLRVDFAEHPDGSRVPFGGAATQAMGTMAATYGLPQPPSAPGGAAAGAPADAVTRRLAEVSPRQMHDIMVQMRALAAANAAQARAMLVGNAPLTRALFQAQLMLGMVASAAEAAPLTLAGGPQPPQPPPPQAWQPPPPQFMPPPMPPPAFAARPPPPQAPGFGPPQPPPPLGMHPGGYGPPPPGWLGPGQMHAPHAPPHAPPPQPPPQPPPAFGGMLSGMDPAAAQALLQQVMRLTAEQVAALPEAERQQVLMLQQLARGGPVR